MNNTFKDRLMLIRQKKNVGQAELAKYLGVSTVTVSRWESGLHEPNLNRLILIARYFEVKVDYLIGLKN